MKQGEIVTLECPKCGVKGDNKFRVSWTIEGKGSVKTRIEIFKCMSCRKKWRRGVPLGRS